MAIWGEIKKALNSNPTGKPLNELIVDKNTELLNELVLRDRMYLPTTDELLKTIYDGNLSVKVTQNYTKSFPATLIGKYIPKFSGVLLLSFSAYTTDADRLTPTVDVFYANGKRPELYADCSILSIGASIGNTSSLVDGDCTKSIAVTTSPTRRSVYIPVEKNVGFVVVFSPYGSSQHYVSNIKLYGTLSEEL